MPLTRPSGPSRSPIRYYEGKELLPGARRDATGYRSYGNAELARIRFVTSARRLGCSFAEIKSLIALQEEQHIPSSKLLNLLKHKIVEIENEMERSIRSAPN